MVVKSLAHYYYHLLGEALGYDPSRTIISSGIVGTSPDFETKIPARCC